MLHIIRNTKRTPERDKEATSNDKDRTSDDGKGRRKDKEDTGEQVSDDH